MRKVVDPLVTYRLVRGLWIYPQYSYDQGPTVGRRSIRFEEKVVVL